MKAPDFKFNWVSGVLYSVPLARIRQNPRNPRKNFDQTALEELAASIKEVGILMPLVVVPDDENEEYLRIVAGERRWRAAQIAGLAAVPAVVQRMTPEQEAQVMLIENLQRQDLDPIEEARAFQTLTTEHGWTQVALAEKLGVSQPHIANRIRLLELPDEVLEGISRGILTVAHGKVLLSVRRWPALVKAMVKEVEQRELNARALEEEISRVIRSARDWSRRLFRHPYGYDSDAPVFDMAKCAECADRFETADYQGETRPYCMRLECFNSKQAEAVNLKAKLEKEKSEKALERAKKQGKKIVKLRNLPKGSYEVLGTQGHYDYLDRAKCVECEKCGVAENHNGIVVEICLDPACIRRQKAAHTRAKGKETRAVTERKIERVVTQAAAAVAGALDPELQTWVDGARAHWATAAKDSLENRMIGAGGEMLIDRESLMTLEAFFAYNKTRHELCAGATSMPVQLGETTVAIPEQGVRFKGGELSHQYVMQKHESVRIQDGDLVIANNHGHVIDRVPEGPIYYRIRAVAYSGSKVVQQMMAVRTPSRTIFILGSATVTMRKDLFARWVKLANGLPAIEAPGPAEEQPEAPTAEEAQKNLDDWAYDQEIDTGHLRRMTEEQAAALERAFDAEAEAPNNRAKRRREARRQIITLKPDEQGQYVPVPPELQRAAELKLAGQNEAMVSLTSGGKLSRWAAKQRKERTARKRRDKRNMAEALRRRNR